MGRMAHRGALSRRARAAFGAALGAVLTVLAVTTPLVGDAQPFAVAPHAAVAPVNPSPAPATSPYTFRLGNLSEETLALENNTLEPGNPSVLSCNAPSPGAVDPVTDQLIGLCQASVAAVNLSAGQAAVTIAVGSGPDGVGIDERAGRAYVANSYSGTVSVIDPHADGAIATIPVGGSPAGVVPDETLGEVLIGNQASGHVSVLNTSTDNVTGEIATGNETSMSLNPWNGDLYVVDGNDSRVVVVNVSGGTILRSLPVGREPVGIAFDPSDGVAFVENLGDGNVSAIDPGTWTVTSIALRDASDLTDHLTFDPADGDLYIVLSTGYLEAISGSNYTSIALVAVGGTPEAVAYDSVDDELYVANAGTANVSIVNATDGIVEGAVVVGGDPAGLAVDPTTGGVAVSEPGRDAIAVVPPGLPRSGRVVFVNHEPSAILYDNVTRDQYVTFSDNGAIADMHGVTDRLIAFASVGDDPTHEVLDDRSGSIWVSNTGSNNVTVFDPEHDRVVANFGGGSGEDALIWDPASDRVAVANYNVGNLTVFNATTLRAVGSVGVGSYPIALAVDPATGLMFSLSAWDRNITEVSGTTNIVVGTLGLGGATPVGMLFDPATGHLDVATIAPNGLQVFDASTGTRVANVSLNGTTDGLGLDPSTDEIYVPYLGGGSAAYIAIINAATDSIVQEILTSGLPSDVLADTTARLDVVLNSNWALVLGSGTGHPQLAAIPTGEQPRGLASNSIMGTSFIGDPYEGAISILYPQHVYDLTFEERGLPAATNWTFDVYGISITTDASSVEVPAHNGTVAWSVDATGAWFPTPSAGATLISGDPQSILISFGPVYPVTFQESGLPAGTWWSVTLNITSNASNGSHIGFSLGNGSFSYNVSGPAGWAGTPAGGPFTVAGRALQFPITFTPPPRPFAVTLRAAGLPEGTRWAASVNGSLNATVGPQMTWFLDNGTYPTNVSGIPGFHLDAYVGTIVVDGVAVTETLNWTVTSYPVVFLWQLQPVPPGSAGAAGSNTSWDLVLNGIVHSSPVGQSLVLNLSNGSYVYAAEPAQGYALYGTDSGEFNVSGTNRSIVVGFAVIASGPPPPAGPFGTPFALVATIGVAAVLGTILLVLIRRHRDRSGPH